MTPRGTLRRLGTGVVLLAVLSVDDARPQQLYRPATPLGLDEYFWIPEDNPLTDVKVALGRRLFVDPLLSADRTVACASCHQPSHAFSDGTRFSRGVRGQRPARHTPSILNRAYGEAFFWDGRAPTLEQTVLQPIQNLREMDLTLVELVGRLRADSGYGAAFATAFAEGISEETVARALASYVRTLRSGNAPVDRYLFGDTTALASQERAGMRLFLGRANCVACHAGPTFTDEQFHNTGVSWGSGDAGRHGVTGREEDRGAFKTPSLRNVDLTAPYMHDGSVATLEAVIDFYDQGAQPNPHLDPEIRPLGLTPEQRRQLIAFLRALTGEIPPP